MSEKKVILLLSLLSIFTIGCGESINSNWKTQDITIDGSGEDWEGLPLQYHEDLNVVYGVVNDEKTIDFMIRFNDERLARMFSMRGFALWLNGEESQDKEIGIHYGDQSMRDQFIAEMRKRSVKDREDESGQIAPPKPAGKFQLAKNDTLTSIPLKDIPGFIAAADHNQGIFCFEFSIPLTSESGSPFYLNTNYTQEIQVGLEILGISKEEQERIKEEMEERRSAMQVGNSGARGMGGKRGGMRGGGRSGGGNRPQMPDMDGEEYWISIQLAAK